MTDSIVSTRPAQGAIEAPGPIALIQQAIQQGTPPEVIRELVALQQSMERFNWEREERQAKIDFDTALNSCQSKIGRIAPNQERENNIGWADYVQLDRTIRPVYLEAGFSVGFSEAESSDKGRLRMCATVSRGGVSRQYFAEISRAPGNGKMNQTDADAAAASRVKRYLMLDIFNIAVGIDKDEKAPFAGGQRAGSAGAAGSLDEKVGIEHEENIKNAGDMKELERLYLAARKAAKDAGDVDAGIAFEKLKNARIAQLRKDGKA